MQQLQESVLNKIQPGTNPIFIISPNKHDGDHLALLLSNNLFFKHTNSVSQENEQNKNYFTSPDEQRLFQLYDKIILDKTNVKKKLAENTNNSNSFTKDLSEISNSGVSDSEGTSLDITSENQSLPGGTDKDINPAKKIEEFITSLKFVLDKGLDIGSAWGVQLDYQMFFDLQLNTLYPNAFFIFLYGTKIKKTRFTNQERSYLGNIIKFYKEHKQNSILIHVNNIVYTPAIVLESLPLDYEIGIRNISSLTSNVPDQNINDLYLFSNDSGDDHQLKKDFDRYNLIAQPREWFVGSDILAILIIGDANYDVVSRKIISLSNSFFSELNICIVCKSNTEKYTLQNFLKKTRLQTSHISYYINYENVANCLNSVIEEIQCSHIIVDNLALSYSTYNILSPYKKFQPSPTFISGSLEVKSDDTPYRELSVVNMLTTRTIPDSISFSKQIWDSLKGFDTSFEDNFAIWDFCIRCLKQTNGYALETEAKESVSIDKSYDAEQELITFEGYKKMVEYHSLIYKEHVTPIIKAISQNQSLTQKEIKSLNNKITNLNSIIHHSKDEVISLTQSRNQLQHQINLLESRWHFKLMQKLNHIKKIFIKEKSSSKNIIVNFLKFLLFSFTKPGFRIIRKVMKGGFRRLYLITEDRPVKIVYLDDVQGVNGTSINTYNDWINNKLDKAVLRKEYDETIGTFKLTPKISVIMPVYNPPIKYLKEAIESVVNQLYGNWELCIADDCSPNPQIKRLLNSYSIKDKRIKVEFRTENGHIAAASNSALSLTTGDYILLMDHDDALTQNCMFEIVRHINAHPEDKFIYSDEDKVDDTNTFSDPFFKPDWSPDRFLSLNYMSHASVVEKKLIDSINGFRLGFDGSQDYDLYLRITEMTDKIGHIPKILYHWRIHPESVASAEGQVKTYAYVAAKRAIEEALVRRNTPGEVKYLSLRGCYRIKYHINSYDKVSIIIPTKDQVQLMKNTIDSILALTSYPNYEIIVLNNNSTSKEFFGLMKEYTEQHGDIFRCVDAPFPFNFSKLINLGVSICEGKYVLMLNNDVEIIQRDWVTNMVSYAQQERIGAVGVKLLYPDDNIQHAGTIIGLGGVAGHLMTGVYKDTMGYFNCLQLTTNYSAVTAACLMVRKSVYEEVGGMEELLEVEYNDVDFCLKIADHGYFNIYVPEVTLYHYESATRGHPHQNSVSYQRHLREVAYFRTKWQKYILNDPFYNPNLSLNHGDLRLDFKK